MNGGAYGNRNRQAERVHREDEGIEEKLDDAKDKWAETATTDPDTARRQLRSFWGIVGFIAGILVGGFAVYMFG